MNPKLLTTLLTITSAALASLYSSSSSVIQLNEKSLQSLLSSNHTSLIEFYAPWCGHCRNLQPIYEKVAGNLHSLVPVAAINCDDDTNKPICAQMGIQGYPTLKIAKPRKGSSKKATVDEYRGERSAGALVEAVSSLVTNHVARITEKEITGFLTGDGVKVILFTEKGGTSLVMRSLAIDYLGAVSVGQVRSKEKKVAANFGVTVFPTLVAIVGSDGEKKIYSGELKKPEISKWLSQFATPNKDARLWDKIAKSKASNAAKSTQKKETSKNNEENVEPVKKSVEITFASDSDVIEACLAVTSKTCILVFNDGDEKTAETQQVTEALDGYETSWPVRFAAGKTAERIRRALEADEGVKVAVVNAKRGWIVETGDVEGAGVISMVESAKDGSGKRRKFEVKKNVHDEL